MANLPINLLVIKVTINISGEETLKTSDDKARKGFCSYIFINSLISIGLIPRSLLRTK